MLFCTLIYFHCIFWLTHETQKSYPTGLNRRWKNSSTDASSWGPTARLLHQKWMEFKIFNDKVKLFQTHLMESSRYSNNFKYIIKLTTENLKWKLAKVTCQKKAHAKREVNGKWKEHGEQEEGKKESHKIIVSPLFPFIYLSWHQF